MRISLIGTTQAHRGDGTPVALGGARLRALLTVLAMRPGRTVPVGRIVDEVWAGDPPADAPGAVQALVGRLRRTLGRDAVGSAEGGGYLLCAGTDDVDLHRFDRLTAQGAKAVARGDARAAEALLDEALELWRGPVLADLPDRDAEAARWEARRLDARRTRLDALLALGRAQETLPELAELCAAHPLDEPLRVLRLRALAAAGRPAQALAEYDAFRRRLADRLGADPGPALRDLHRELLSTGGAATATAAPETVPAPETAPAPAPEAGPVPAPEAGPVRRGNLRARLTSFVGREHDLAALRDDLAAARLVTLLGPGGAGKTRLSQEAAERTAPDAPDGVWFAELASVDDPDDVAEAVLSVLGVRQTVLRGSGAEELRAADRHGDDPLVRLVEHCSRRRMLLVLDNCEHVVGAAAALAETLLTHCPGLRVLATSREQLAVPGELLRPVGPLPDPSALRLFAERGAAARPGFSAEDDPEACAEICRRLDGLPLAIELAAARLRMLTPRQIADRLDDRFRLLTAGSRTVLPRQQTLRAVVDWSWDLLDASERAVLRRLSVFSGGCELAAAEAVCADAGAGTETDSRSDSRSGGGVDVHDIASLLGSLIDKSLVVAEPGGPDGMRYRLLETVAEYAAERLGEAGERAGAERRHLVHHRELARAADPMLRGPDQVAAIALIQREYENLRTALRRAIAARDEQEALCLVLYLAWYWQIRDLRAEARHWSGAAAALGPDPFAPPVAPAPPVFERFTDAPPPMGPELLQEARRGNALIHMTFFQHDNQAWSSAESLERMRGVVRAYRPGLPQTCRSPGALWFFAVLMTGEADRLKDMLDETVRACRALGYDWELASALQSRAGVLANRGLWAPQATRDADEALEMFIRIGDSWGAAEALSARGESRERRGEYALAAEDFATALGYAERVGARTHVAVFRARLGGILLELGEEECGERVIREVLAENDGVSNECTAVARIYLSLWLGRTGRRPEAREHVRALIDQFHSNTMAIFEGMVVGYLAWLDLADGLPGQALDQARYALEQALDPLCRVVAPQLAVVHLVTAADALAQARPERAADAARLLGASDVQRPEAHFASAHERKCRAEAEASVRAALGDDAYASAYAEGGALTLEEAAALV
ncbi:BTAD domain-containing putative transcriptional regulator [Streptomyces sp. NPDC014894]|uniref:AfsR/SARP family transcriptional regulator n=1 Tax=Streptomyces sp. NPDC014894 TaxID=3364931 RepID=UPI0036F54F13